MGASGAGSRSAPSAVEASGAGVGVASTPSAALAEAAGALEPALAAGASSGVVVAELSAPGSLFEQATQSQSAAMHEYLVMDAPYLGRCRAAGPGLYSMMMSLHP